MATSWHITSLLLLIVGLAVACGLGLSEDDRSRLAQVEERFGDRYRFLSKTSLYLEAYRTAAGEPSEQEARTIYEAFWISDGKPRSDSQYVYLNVYDAEEDFVLQLYWDPDRREVVRSSTSHY
jgi:hypothetical protein